MIRTVLILLTLPKEKEIMLWFIFFFYFAFSWLRANQCKLCAKFMQLSLTFVLVVQNLLHRWSYFLFFVFQIPISSKLLQLSIPKLLFTAGSWFDRTSLPNDGFFCWGSRENHCPLCLWISINEATKSSRSPVYSFNTH